MMLTLWFLLAEIFVIGLFLSTILFVSNWRKKKKLTKTLESLLTNVTAMELSRQEGLQKQLVDSTGYDVNQAESLSVELIQAERKLFRGYAESLLTGEYQKIGTFDKTVYAVLDQYWKLLQNDPEKTETEAASETATEPDTTVPKSDDIDVVAVDQDDDSEGSESASEQAESGPEQAEPTPQDAEAGSGQDQPVAEESEISESEAEPNSETQEADSGSNPENTDSASEEVDDAKEPVTDAG